MLRGEQTGRVISDDADVTSRCRCVHRPGSYMIFPRANRVEHRLPHFNGVLAQVLASPQQGARFVEHELLIEPNGGTAKGRDEELEQFFFVLEGELSLKLKRKTSKLVQGSFAWLPPNRLYAFDNPGKVVSRVIWIRRQYEEVEGVGIPEAIVSHQSEVPAIPTDTYMEQHLTPYEQLGFDMGINLQTFDAGVHFSFVEAHVMEHGLYMLTGQGIYWLNHDFHEVQQDDFIYMAPYCPQFFYATGRERSAYLLYKDVNRDYSQALNCNGSPLTVRRSRQ